MKNDHSLYKFFKYHTKKINRIKLKIDNEYRLLKKEQKKKKLESIFCLFFVS